MTPKRSFGILLLVACLSCIASHAVCTEKEGGIICYTVNIHHGKMTPHYTLQAKLNQDKITGIDVNVIFLNRDETHVRSTTTGLGGFVSNLGNNKVYGYVYASYFSLLLPLPTEKLPVQLKLAMGPAYVTQKHHPEKNPLNRALGTHVNAFGQISLTSSIPLVRDRWFLRAGASFNHVSNGLTKAPNQGINTLTFHAGLDLSSAHRHSGTFFIAQNRTRTEPHCISIWVASGFKEVDEAAGKNIITSSLLLDYTYGVLPAINTGLGAGFYYNDTWAHGSYPAHDDQEQPLPFQAAVHLVVEMEKNPVTLLLNPGFYFYKPSKDTPDFTSRLGVRYTFRNNLSLMFAVKHHWFALADYFEWGMGYRFFR